MSTCTLFVCIAFSFHILCDAIAATVNHRSVPLMRAAQAQADHASVKITAAASLIQENPSASVIGAGTDTNRPVGWDALIKGTVGTRLPKNLWMFWEQGDLEKTAPPLNKLAFEKWQTLNPGWTYNLVTKETLPKLCPELHELFQSRPGTFAARSDMIRLAILAEHGGVWADGSLLPLRALDTFAPQLVEKSGFFVFTYPDKDDPFAHYAETADPAKTFFSSWFIASEPKNPLILAWRDSFKDKWMSHSNFRYFEVHFTLKELILKNVPKVAGVWKTMPRISSHWPQHCTNQACPEFWKTVDVLDRPPVMKRPYAFTGKAPPQEWLNEYLETLPPKGT